MRGNQQQKKNEIIDCFDGMGFIGQTKFSLEQMAELEERFRVHIPDELENTIEEEYVWVFHDDEH